jgi:hypothetical protein
MARTVAGLPAGARITDYISLGVIAKVFPEERVKAALAETKRASIRQRELPGHVVVYYVIALALYMQASYGEVLSCLLEGLQWLAGPKSPIKVTGKSGISQARTRVGYEPLKRLYDDIVSPIATPATPGAWYGTGRKWRLVSLDGSTLAVPDTDENDEAFGRPNSNHGEGGMPRMRFVCLVENGTHVLFGARMDAFTVGEITLAHEVIQMLEPGMLCLADRYFAGYRLLERVMDRGSDVLWRVRVNANLPCEKRLKDGSYLSCIVEPQKSKSQAHRINVRVVEYRLSGLTNGKDEKDLFRLITTILDPDEAPASELAALYQERWEIETAFDELKTHLRGASIVLRSKTPDLIRQEFFGMMMAHYAVRKLMHEAALRAHIDPDRLSFVNAIRVVRRRIPMFVGFPPSEVDELV